MKSAQPEGRYDTKDMTADGARSVSLRASVAPPLNRDSMAMDGREGIWRSTRMIGRAVVIV